MLTVMSDWTSSSVSSLNHCGNGYEMPTLFTSTPTSIDDSAVVMRFVSFLPNEPKSTTSVLTSTFGYLAVSSALTAASFSAERATSITFMPLRANSKAIALPMPSVPPVTTAHSP